MDGQDLHQRRRIVVARKIRRAITAADVPRVFSYACIEQLASIGPLPEGADLKRFAAGVRAATGIYARDAREPDPNELHQEIAALYTAAQRRQYDRVASLREGLSPQACRWLKARMARPGPRAAGLKLPSSKALRGRGRRDEACASIERLCRAGGGLVAGRKRPSGKRSRPVFRELLHAPKLRQHVPKRGAELTFVSNLAAAWLDATGESPARTANRRAPGPFARLVRKCLELVGAPEANAINLINELDRRRREVNRG
jgi:hypothetical protein